MSFFGELAKGGVEGLAGGIGQLAKDIRTAITGEAPIDPNRRAELLVQIQALEAASTQAAADFDKAQMEGQVAINKLEAASQDKFVSRWRPFIGWVCGIALAYEMIFRGVLAWIMMVVALVSGADVKLLPPLPSADLGDMVITLLGMLGLGTMRSFDKHTRARIDLK